MTHAMSEEETAKIRADRLPNTKRPTTASTSSAAISLDLKKVLEDMARAIVDNPDSVSVTEEIKEDETVLTLHVAEDDMGMIIGKHGKIARALRTVTKAAAKMADQKIVVEIK